MPEPRPGEGRVAFVSRCIPYVAKEEPNKKHEYHVAKCFGIYRTYLKNKRKK